jgi:acyl dehydratase
VVALNPDFVGRTWPATPPYLVAREKIREFAAAVGDLNPFCHDPEFARAAGHPDVVAPPTFVVVVTRPALDAVMFDPDLGLDYSMVVHGEQRFRYTQAIHAGDTLSVVSRLTNVRAMGGNDILTVEADVSNAAGEHVVTATAVIVSRGTAQEG